MSEELVFNIPNIKVVGEVTPLPSSFDNLKLVPYDDPILREPMPRFDFNNPPFDPAEFAVALVKVMRDNSGLGLSANQVGVRVSCFALVGDPNLVCYNPHIIGYGEEEVIMEEGCLSYPQLFMKIKRKKNVKMRFALPNGEVVTRVFAGLTARIAQHEYSHCVGKIPLGETSKINIIQGIDRARRDYKRNYYLKYLLNEVVEDGK